MIHDLALRWVVTTLFVLGAAESGLAIVTERRVWTSVLGHGSHCLMAVAMAVMAWPWGTRVPTTGPAVFFLLAAIGFAAPAVFAAPTTALRILYGYHGLMMLATAWMYAGMDLAPLNTPASSGWFGAVNWFGTVSFAAAAVFWTSRYIMDRRRGAARCRAPGNLGQATMAAGMAMLFLAMLMPI